MGVRVTVQFTARHGIAAEILAGIVRGENLAAERLLALSAERAPLDVGTLVGSGTVEVATDAEQGSQVVYDTPYAARLHEHPEYRFQQGRQGKYVEGPAVENRAELRAIIAKEAMNG
ncbi:hypothetical protein MN032_17835 [Agromyces atrinae]|uniref:hypothetical protein n=1 Tax=Agromyces atrinae TaxID=592376 RepID=UPI001F5977D8|nr:hypothetical protein [Agromyces atrinae]MCI2959549.1 hypothetical protein [Agromyces atrinae]